MAESKSGKPHRWQNQERGGQGRVSIHSIYLRDLMGLKGYFDWGCVGLNFRHALSHRAAIQLPLRGFIACDNRRPAVDVSVRLIKRR